MTDGNAYLILGFCSYLVKQLESLPPDNYVFSQENTFVFCCRWNITLLCFLL